MAGDVTVTMCGLRYVGHGVLAYILELKLNSEVSKSISHVPVLYNIDVTCRHGNDTTCCIILHATASFSTYNEVIYFIAYFHSSTYNGYSYQSILFVCHLVCEFAYIYNVYVCL